MFESGTQRLINKDDIVDFLFDACDGISDKKSLSRLSKTLLFNKLCEFSNESQENYVKVCNHFCKQVAVTPTELEELLKCTRAERMRWASEGKFKEVCTRDFKISGLGKRTYKCYDRLQVESITPAIVEQWRQEHLKSIVSQISKSRSKAIETRKTNNELIRKSRIIIDDLFNKWKSVNDDLFTVFKLAYWTMWINRWAKTYELKSLTAHSLKSKYSIISNVFYFKKDLAIKLLAGTDFAKVSYYRPKLPDKISVYLCDYHYDNWCLERSFNYMSKSDYYYSHRKEIDNCNYCDVNCISNYYSLYFIEICSDLVETRFSYHIPELIGSSYLPDPSTLPRVNQEEFQQSVFRFGRAVEDVELITHSAKVVELAFNQAVQDFIKHF